MKKNYSLLLVSVLILGFHSNGQQYIDLLNLQYQSTSLNKFDSSSNETMVSEYAANATFPLKINDRLAILTGFTSNSYDLDLTHTGKSATVSSYLLKVGANIKHGDKWSGTYMLLPKLASDFEKGSKTNDFQMGAVALLKYEKRDNFNYKLGLYYNGDRFGNFFVPILGLYHKKNRFEANLTLPVSADANYELKKNFHLGANFRAIVKSFNLRQSYESGGAEYLQQKSNELTTYLSYELNNGILFRAHVGYSIGRSYRIYRDGDQMDFGISAFSFGDNRTQLNSDFDDGLLYRLEMVYRFHLD